TCALPIYFSNHAKFSTITDKFVILIYQIPTLTNINGHEVSDQLSRQLSHGGAGSYRGSSGVCLYWPFQCGKILIDQPVVWQEGVGLCVQTAREDPINQLL